MFSWKRKLAYFVITDVLSFANKRKASTPSPRMNRVTIRNKLIYILYLGKIKMPEVYINNIYCSVSKN